MAWKRSCRGRDLRERQKPRQPIFLQVSSIALLSPAIFSHQCFSSAKTSMFWSSVTSGFEQLCKILLGG